MATSNVMNGKLNQQFTVNITNTGTSKIEIFGLTELNVQKQEASESVATDITSKFLTMKADTSEDALRFMKTLDENLEAVEQHQRKTYTEFLLYIIKNSELLCVDTEIVRTKVKLLLKDRLNAVQSIVLKENLMKLYNADFLNKIKTTKYEPIFGKPILFKSGLSFIEPILRSIENANTYIPNKIISYEHINNFLANIVISTDANFMYIDHKFSMVDVMVWKNRPAKIDEAIKARLLTITRHASFGHLSATNKIYLENLTLEFSSQLLKDSVEYNKQIVFPILPENEEIRAIYPLFIKLISKVAANNVISIIRGYVNCQDTTKTDTNEIIQNIIDEFNKKESMYNETFQQLYSESFSVKDVISE